MNLRGRLTLQSVRILLVTVAVTVLVGVIYTHLFGVLPRQMTDAAEVLTIVRQGDQVVYFDTPLTRADVQEIQMRQELGEQTVTLYSSTYRLTAQGDDNGYHIVKLTPVMEPSDSYSGLPAVVILTFLIVFAVSMLLSQRSNRKQIVQPVLALTDAAQKLKEGNLDTEVPSAGEAEIRALCDAVEQLRLQLKESVYYREKTDDNRKFLISSISHDLKTPVTAIRGYLEGILDGVAASDEKKEQYLRAALTKTDTLRCLIDDLLLYSKLDLKQIPFQLETLEVEGYLTDCVKEWQLRFAEKQKTITLSVAFTGTRRILADRQRLSRVVQNILDNADKHTVQGGRVDVFLRENNASVIMEFRDNGSGVKKEDLPHIFDRFYRGDAARASEGSSGLGLAICKQIIEGMGGLIWAISEENCGTSILISMKKTDRRQTHEAHSDH